MKGLEEQGFRKTLSTIFTALGQKVQLGLLRTWLAYHMKF